MQGVVANLPLVYLLPPPKGCNALLRGTGKPIFVIALFWLLDARFLGRRGIGFLLNLPQAGEAGHHLLDALTDPWGTVDHQIVVADGLNPFLDDIVEFCRASLVSSRCVRAVRKLLVAVSIAFHNSASSLAKFSLCCCQR